MSEDKAQQSPWIVETRADTFQDDVFQRSHQCPVVVDFWAAWCQPCRLLTPLLENLAIEHEGKFVLVKANTEQVPEAAAEFAVQAIPSVYAVRDGHVVDFFTGVLPEDSLRSWLEQIQPSEAEQLCRQAANLLVADPDQSENLFRQALALDPRLVEASLGLAQLLLEQNRDAECREIIDQLQERGFLEPEAEAMRAALDVKQQAAASAGDIESLRAAVAAAPDDLKAELNLAQALAAAEQFEESLRHALRIVEQDRRGLGEDARKLMVDVFRLLPDDSELARDYRRKLSAALY